MEPITEDQKKYFKLTHAQKRIYYDDKMYPGTSVCTQAFLVRYKEILDKSILEKAINKVIQKNDGFRLRIVEIDFDPEPSQYLSPFKETSIETFDFTGPDNERRLRVWVERITKKALTLLDSDLFYFAYIKYNENESGYYMKFHHIASDGGSYPLIFSEINKIYEEIKEGRPVDENPNLSYIPYIAEEQAYLESSMIEKDKEFWHNTFLPLPEPLSLSSKTSVQSSNIDGCTFITTFPNHVKAAIDEYCKTNKTSLFKLMLAVLSSYVARVTGMEDIAIATVNHNRAEAHRKNVVGMYVSTLPLRLNIDGKMTFNAIVDKAGNDINYILKNHQKYPFDRLATELREITNSEVGHLVDIIISAHGDVKKEKYTFEHIFQGFAPNAVTIHINYNNKYQDGILELEYEYQLERFSEEDINRIHQGLVNILSDALPSPNKTISEIDLLSSEEKHLILNKFNDTKVEYIKDKTLHELFLEQVENYPDRTGLVFRDQHLSYRALYERASHLAYILRSKGVGPNTIAAVMTERSLEMIIGIMGVLFAGGAYLPIDPTYPKNRIQYLCKDSNSKAILTQEKYINNIDFELDKINLNDSTLFLTQKDEIEYLSSPENLAYIIYTSGSTGLPKGVMINHVSAANLLFALDKLYPLESSDVYLLKTSYSFDVSVSEIFGWFWHGGKLAILEPEGEKDPFKIMDTIEKENATHINFVPSMFNIFVDSMDNLSIKKLSEMKYIFLAGEAIRPESILKFRELDSRIIIDNLYGPTEATVYSTIYPVGKWIGSGSIPIGIPVDNLKAYIINTKGGKDFTLQPVGVPGELCFSGIGLARGYLNRPELTAEKFVDNPFEEKNDLEGYFKKLYRTGDLVRWMPDGNIEYFGRIDFQVKIRGFRIETGEIESQILAQKDQLIKEAIVVAREDTAGEKYLCAYLVADKKINISELDESLSKSLMDYMKPSYFVQIDSIPLTSSGKVDRKKLPDPKIKARGEGYAAPRNEIETKLIKIWAEILRMGENIIGIDDNFFKIGGHSLKAAVMLTVIHKAFNVKVLMHQIFEMPTVRKLGEFLKGATEEAYSSIERCVEKEYYLQTSAQKRLFFMDQIETNNTVYNLQLMDIYCKGVEKDGLEKALQKLIKRHESLRTSFHIIEGEAVQKIHDFEEAGVDFKIEYYETAEDGMIYSDQEGKEWTRVTGIPFQDVVEHFVRPFDLTKPPLFRAGLVKIFGNTQILMLDMHHIISDGTSLGLMAKEMWALYDESELHELRIQYKDYAEWMNGEAKKQEIKKQEPFWLNEFSGEIPILNLPYDFPRPTKPNFNGDILYFDIEKEDARILKKLVHDKGETLFMMLLAAFNILLAKLNSQEDIIIGTWTAGRSHADLHQLIGMFVDTLALRNYPSSDKIFSDFLKELKEKTIRAFENQDYPFDQLVSKVVPNHDSNRNPLFDVVFGWENTADISEEYLLEVLMLDKTSPYHFNVRKSKFDIMLMGAEREEKIQFYIEYNTSIFKEETIGRFIRYFKKIVSSITSNTRQKISEIEFLSELEKNEIIFTFNDTAAVYPKDKTIHELFEDQVEQTPNSIAAQFRNQTLTYCQLNEKANQLARLLRKKGVGQDVLVGIMVSRSLEMLVGLLAILKAGGGYIPLDPEYPGDRIEYMLKDSATKLLLINKPVVEKLKEINVDIETIDISSESIYVSDKTNLERESLPDNLAYVIYTSGSTGKPKGVMIRQRNAVNFIKGMVEKIDFSPGKTILALTTLCFDIFFLETMLPLTIGLKVVVAEESQQKDPDELKKLIKENDVNLLQLTPSRLKLLLSSGTDYSYLDDIQEILIGGEGLPKNLFSELKEKYRGKIIDVYGPTETTVWSTLKDLTGQDEITIGIPIANTQVYIVDKSLNLQPMGVVGELYIGGDGVSRGYLNRPELTSERFIKNPFELINDPDRPYKEIYQTGDLARWLPDGSIDCLGRVDHQVKIRGFRIETGEIESQLLKLPGIIEAVVVVRDDPNGEKYLCAYLVSDLALNMMEVREPLSKILPDYMVPSYFVQIEKIPLTPNGKVDRKALPEPDDQVITTEYVAPTNEMEKLLAEVWSSVLGIQQVGINDNFFQIGGDSLKTILVAARMKRFNFSLSINDFFSNRTIKELAKYVKKMELVEEKKPSFDMDLTTQKIEEEYKQYINRLKSEKLPDLTTDNKYKHILLTGATGYLGAFLANELIKNTSAILYLPVRSRTEEEAIGRLKAKMDFYFGKQFYGIHKDRLVVLKANLIENKLGIIDEQYQKLSETVEAVVHSAANVKHYGKYEELYKDNVDATIMLLEFALTNRKKDFHFISTLDTGRGDIPGKAYNVFTEYCHDVGQKSDHVYIRSKLEAEKKVLEYRDKGLNTSIFRAGNVTFNTENGEFQENIENNVFYAILRVIAKVGPLSENMKKIEFDMSFVNYTAKSIVSLLTRKNLVNGTYHVNNPNKLKMADLVEFLKGCGIEVPIAQDGDYQKHLEQYEGKPEYEKIIERVKIDSWAWESIPATIFACKNDRTVHILKEIYLEWPKVNQENVEKMIAHCKNVGFL